MVSMSSAVFRSCAALPIATVHALWIIRSDAGCITRLSPAMKTTDAALHANPSQIVTIWALCSRSTL